MVRFSSPSPMHGLLIIVMAAALTGVLFGASPILAWTKQLPDSVPYRAEMEMLANRWHNDAEHLGLTIPYDSVRALERRVEEYRFAPAPD